MLKNINWDDYFMSMVYLVAMRSKDESTHVGAVVVGPDNEVRSLGYNGFPRGLIDNVLERQKRPEKYFWIEHAERNAFYNATLIGVSLKGCRMYTNGTPCMDCGRGVVQSGIVEVIVDKNWEKHNPPEWENHANKTKVMFDEVGIKLRHWEGKTANIEKFMRGEKI
ncbi:MAG: deaminase [Nanoarchaeota archaeon]|nr:deaminase [Nanoarchaeota archaeon]